MEGKRKKGPDGRTGRDPWFRGKKKKRNRKYYYYFGARKGRRRKWKMLRQKGGEKLVSALGKWKEEFDSFSGQKRGGRREKEAGGRQISMT